MSSVKITAVYPGTFDPITNGHADIAMRAARLFSKVYVAVADNTDKKTLFSTEARIELAQAVLTNMDNVVVCGLENLVTDLARQLGAKVIVRGLRASAEFDYEFQMAGMNRKLYAEADTVFLRPSENLSFVSSTLVREIAALGGDVRPFVHNKVFTALTSGKMNF